MIHVLDQHTIDKIAAGEVIERPASVVKELVENSIDAGATRITIEITDGGTTMIRVTDNGSGIEADDVRKAYFSHATSKLESVDDLMNIVSLGFRGEALSTIAAVSEVEMVTKTHEAMTGIRYVIEGGKELQFKEVGTPDGTTIISKNLFFNTPARKKFLKSNMTEGSYINDLISHIALANPEVAIKLISGGKIIVDTQGDGRLKETIFSLFGKDITKGLLETNYIYDIETGQRVYESENDDADNNSDTIKTGSNFGYDNGSASDDSEKIKITGYIGKPYISKGNRSFENYFVNKRYIKSPVVSRAIEEAYKTHIMQHKFPFTALFIDVPTYMVDVNVHPAKREFRFDNEKALFSAVFHAVQDALTEKEFIPDTAENYNNKQNLFTPQETVEREKAAITDNIKSTIDSRSIIQPTYKAEDKPYNNQKYNTYDNATGIVRETADFNTKSQPAKTNTFDNNFKASSGTSGNSFSILESLLPKSYRDKMSESIESDKSESIESEKSESIETEKSESIKADITSTAVDTDTYNVSKPVKDTKEIYVQEELTETRYLSEEALPKHRIIGLAFDTYWITEYEDCLYLMDQHAAHEKVNYETFLKEFKERTIHSQNIFPPEVFSLSGREKQAVLENIEYMRKCGFEIEDFGGNEVKISAVPANLLGLGSREVFMELAAYLADEITGLTEDIFVRKLATMGCKAAVKGNQKITVEEVQTLMDRLMKLDNPYTCPHGRPTIIKMTKEELDKKFKRIV
ncbi:DNA mismatch repair protein MutL [Lachnospiraceae bacterium]|nr:DNA mismatch repair protein MutL [Lachnospiraceae bacterium]